MVPTQISLGDIEGVSRLQVRPCFSLDKSRIGMKEVLSLCFQTVHGRCVCIGTIFWIKCGLRGGSDRKSMVSVAILLFRNLKHTQ